MAFFILRAALTVFIIACQCAGVFSCASAASRSVKEIRFRTESDRTRIVLDLSGESRYSIRTADGPFRIVVDLPGCRLADGVRNVEVGDGVLERIRVHGLKTGAQVVLDLSRRAAFTHFALRPDSGKPHRIVIDVAKPEAGGEGSVAKKAAGDANPEERPKPAVRAREGDRIVIIDPGHGGDAPGTISRSGIQEKTLNLKLAKMLKAEIERRSGYRAILVRDSDRDVHWVRRVSFAREMGGELFVSLHFNSNPSRKIRGLELYFLSLQASDDNAAAVAERENLLLEAGADSAGFNDDLKSILFDVSLANAIQRSSVLADEVASVLRADPPIPFRKVKQAPLIVLRGIAMPSILVEGGYLSNRKEAQIVSKDGYLSWLAKSLAEGIVSFLEKHPDQAGSAAGE
ncbi:MAG: N-acetylmuramoyl-L-alanine amidase [Candidatus Krumholzibacteria bacterium]|nr:N-acetylmuramoyl-L-alanine amidase [Candidatus Krumholzibacteria bacterium]